MSLFNELYQPVTEAVFQQASTVRLLICDIDGVFSDGRIYLANSGEELKAFHTRDGYGIKAVRQAGIEVAVITGRHSAIVQKRMTALSVSHIYQGQENKLAAFNELLLKLQLNAKEVAYIGDDLADWSVMQHCGLAVAVKDAHPYLLRQASYITSLPGGYGAVRELCDLLLISQQQFGLFDGSSA
ncbi:3-deoxy-manno-octulosonate-8-phosphatase KdsC [Rheinheimera gaetbuli]